jgi:hypothetical protein
VRAQNGNLLLFSGLPKEGDIHRVGVGILLSRRFSSSLIVWTPVSERIITATLKRKFRNITIVQCYVSTEEGDAEDKETFYDQLGQVVSGFMKSTMIVVRGDFNAKMGEDNEDLRHVMGKHGTGPRKDNGDLLIEFCGKHGLNTGGMLFPHKEHNKVTWVSPDRATQNQIDHICTTGNFSRALLNARNKRGADIGSDHHLPLGTLRIQVRERRKEGEHARRKLNVDLLKETGKKREFITTIRNKIQPPIETSQLKKLTAKKQVLLMKNGKK